MVRTDLVIVLALGAALAAPAVATHAQEAVSADMPVAKLQQVFVDAGRAYDQGNLDQAVALYGSLLKEGQVSAELLFNLGNVYFKKGDVGMAVLHYRRAWRMAPRDPDIRANLRFALQSTGAVAPAGTAAQRLLFALSKAEWIAAAVILYWLSAAGLALLILLPSRRPLLLRATAVLALLLLLSVAGIVSWQMLTVRPEAVVLRTGQQALFAPLDGSTAHFAVPQGSVVRVAETSGGWLKVASGRQTGWLPATACATVYPWTAGPGR